MAGQQEMVKLQLVKFSEDTEEKRRSHSETTRGAQKMTDTTENTEHTGWKSSKQIRCHKNGKRNKKVIKKKEKYSYGGQQRKQSTLIK